VQLEGLYTPVITPFNSDLSIDYAAYGEVLDWQLSHGVGGIIVGGSTGEFFSLTLAERREQIAYAADRIAGRCTLICGVNDLLATQCIELAAAARQAGADALLVAAPPYILPSATELAGHVRAIDDAADLPIILYNYPARSGTAMDDAFIGQVAGIPNVIAIKESSGEIARIHQLVSRFPELQLSAGAEDLVLEFFAWGARSWVSVIANFMPRQAAALYRCCVIDGDFARGRRIMQALLPLMHCLEHGGAFIQCVKQACALRGRPGGPVRPPLAAMPNALEQQLAAAVSESCAAIDNMLAA
jgi:4-hydroxy-tetrahydrodipicolinate synthase